MFKSIPESKTIQNVINFLYPTILNSKEEAKYFLSIIGDNILKKNKNIIHYFSGDSKSFVTALNDKFCNKDSSKCINLAHVLTEKGVYSRIDALNGVPGSGPVYENSNTKGFVIINEVRPSEPKQLDEARGDVVSDYQKYLEKTWLEEIRQKYPVVVNRELLKQMTP